MPSEPGIPSGLNVRAIPTLTEVADEHAQASGRPAPGEPEPPLAGAAADEVLRILQPHLEPLVAEAVSRALHEQLRGLNRRIELAVAAAVREAVMRANDQVVAARPPDR